MQNWTAEEQSILIEALNQEPEARKNAEIRVKLLESVRQRLFKKSYAEVLECYRHVQRNRVAYFKASQLGRLRSADSEPIRQPSRAPNPA